MSNPYRHNPNTPSYYDYRDDPSDPMPDRTTEELLEELASMERPRRTKALPNALGLAPRTSRHQLDRDDDYEAPREREQSYGLRRDGSEATSRYYSPQATRELWDHRTGRINSDY